MLKKLFENTSTKGTFKPIFPIYSLSDLYIIQKRAHNIKSRKTDEWGINGPISWTRSTKNVSKSPNLHPQWGRITLFTLLWDTLYVCFSTILFEFRRQSLTDRFGLKSALTKWFLWACNFESMTFFAKFKQPHEKN